MSDEVKVITDQDFESEVVNSDIPTLIDFWAPWCGPCRAIAPVVEELASEYEGKVKFAKMNVDDNQMTAANFGIRSIPTLLLFSGGKVVDQIVGAVAKAKIEESLKKVIGDS